MQALGLIETKGLLTAIESADVMLKAADVKLLEKTYVGGGLVSITITGDVGAVKAAVEAGAAAVRNINSGLLISEHVIPRPHKDISSLIVSEAQQDNEEMLTVQMEKTEAKEQLPAESLEENTVENPAEDEEIVAHNLTFEDSGDKELLIEKTVEFSEHMEPPVEKTETPLKADLSELRSKDAIDKLVLEYGLEEALEVLGKFKVVELRNLAREYKAFGIAGRTVSKADKKLLLEEFRKYYGQN